jgi:hypothetical protein
MMPATSAPPRRNVFFGALFSPCGGVIELRALPSGGSCFVPLTDGERGAAFIAQQRDHRDLFFGVATRRDARSGALTNCQHLGALFVDADFKTTPEATVRERLAQCLLPPSAIVHSGGGLHVYWLLREPMTLPAEAPVAKGLLRRLALVIGGDLTAAEPARILRVPGTWNHKPDYPDRPPVHLEACDPTRRYNPDDFDSWLPPEPGRDGRAALFAMPARVPEGNRNNMLYRLARSLKARGCGAAAVRAALEEENREKCIPPLADSDVATIAENAMTQPDASTFGGISATEATSPSGGSVDPMTAPPPALVVPRLKQEAFYGLAGRIVECIEPASEADPAAILLHVLLGAGNLIGRTVYAMVEKTRHGCNEFAVLVGQSGKGRKGQAWSTPKALFESVSPEWSAHRVRSGLSSGEGLIYHVRDAREEQQPVKQGGRVVDYQTVVVDPGESDKRLLIFEPELASVLRRMNGETSSLSAVMRQAWESGDLSTLTRREALRATGAHISVIAHVTREELVANLTATERANGFANRFLFCLVQRSKVLPEGGSVPDTLLAPLIGELRALTALTTAEPRALHRTPAARGVWGEVYGPLSAATPGLIGSILGRAEAHVLRLSLIYAALDQAPAVDTVHLKAALALWDFAEASARAIFGGRSGVVDLDTLVGALRARGPQTQTEISALFSRNKTAQELEALLRLGEEAGKVRKAAPLPSGGQGGRPATRWEAVA